MANRLIRSKYFKFFTITVLWEEQKTPTEVELSDAHLGWKYNIKIFQKPNVVAKELHKIADWLEKF